MNFMFLIYIPLVHSASHKFTTTCKGLNGQVVAGIPEFSAVTTLDGQEIDYYDSDTGTLIPKQDWMKEFASTDRWKKYTEIREQVQQTNKINITVLMEQFSQSHGVHMYQRIYGCVWHKTEDSDGFDRYSYDGKNVISLDLKEGRYTAHVQQADTTVMKWNNNKEQFDFLKQYYKHECIDWLKEILNFSRATFKKTGIVSELPGKSLTGPIQDNQTKNDTKSCSKLKPGSFFFMYFFFLLYFRGQTHENAFTFLLLYLGLFCHITDCVLCTCFSVLECASGLYIKLSVFIILVISMTALYVHQKLNKPKLCKERLIYVKLYPLYNPSDKPASPE